MAFGLQAMSLLLFLALIATPEPYCGERVGGPSKDL